mgnify:CR=1 FL=1
MRKKNTKMLPTKRYLHDCWETGFPLKPKNLRTFYPNKFIRKRYSYAFWKDIINDLNILPYKKRIEVASNLFKRLDHRNKFHSEKQASFELESMAFCLLESEGLIKE